MADYHTYWVTCRKSYMSEARKCHLLSNRTYYVRAARECNRRLLRKDPLAMLSC